MMLQIGNKEQIAQWTIFDFDARNNQLIMSDVIDGIEWIVTFRNIYSPELKNYKIEVERRLEQNKVVVNLQILVSCEYPNHLWLSEDYKICEQRSEDDYLTTYSIAFFVSDFSALRPATSCLYHFFLYKKTEALPPITR